MLKNTKEKKKGEWVYWEINQKGYSDICGYLLGNLVPVNRSFGFKRSGDLRRGHCEGNS